MLDRVPPPVLVGQPTLSEAPAGCLWPYDRGLEQ